MVETNSLPNQAVVDVVAWICLQENRVLGARTRGNTVFYLPGGKRKSSETDWTALSREVREELSVMLTHRTFAKMLIVDEVAHGYSEPTYVHMQCFRADYSGVLTPTSEIAAIAWLRYSDLKRCAPATQRVIEYLHEHRLIE